MSTLTGQKNPTIGSVLRSLGYIDEAQTEQALAYQRQHKGTPLGQALIQLGAITEKQLMEALAKRLDLHTVELSELRADMDAVERIPRQLAEKYEMLAIRQNAQTLTVVVCDPLNYYAQEDVRQLTGMSLEILLTEREPLKKAIAFYYAEADARNAARSANATVAAELLSEPEHTRDAAYESGDAPIVKLLDSLIQRAVTTRASDIHVEPFEDHTLVRMRIDGVITDYTRLRPSLHQALCARIKILANLDIAERRIPQDGHFRASLGGGKSINIRVSILPTVFGEKAVIRLLDNQAVISRAGQFGMNDANYRRFLPMLDCPNGIIYITGPTGSGKTTTLYMALEALSKRQVNIATIEDPVEKNLPRVSQTQVNTAAGMSFERGLRAVLRQDPDVIMIGETRDNETASIAVRAAITGHVVFSTLHTNDAASSVARLTDMGVERYLLANSLVGIIAQRLMRRVCPHCARSMPTTPMERQRLGADVTSVTRGEGCPECGQTGYQGRIAIHELMSVDRPLRALISSGATSEQLQNYAVKHQGMQTLEAAGRELVLRGVTTPEELLKVTYYTAAPESSDE